MLRWLLALAFTGCISENLSAEEGDDAAPDGPPPVVADGEAPPTDAARPDLAQPDSSEVPPDASDPEPDTASAPPDSGLDPDGALPPDAGPERDSDGDGRPDAADNCPAVPNPGQADADEDDIGDVCDRCPNTPNGLDANRDLDGDGVAACAGDCDDFDPDRAPGLAERCDGVDEDCDGQVDEGADDCAVRAVLL